MGLPINFDPSQEPPRPTADWRDCKDTYVQGPYYNPIIDEDSGLEVTSEGYLRVCGTSNGAVERLYPGPGIAITGVSYAPTISNTGVIDIVDGGGLTISCVNGVYTLSAGGGGGAPATPVVAGSVFACTTAAGSRNTSLGYNSLGGITTGFNNVAVGFGAGTALTTASNNVILGNYIGNNAQNNNIFLADGAGALRLNINGFGALSAGDLNHGAAGQFLMSQGTNLPFCWSSLPSASETQQGIVEMATTAETIAGACNTLAVSTSGAAAVYLPKGCFQAKGDILGGTGICASTRLPVGANNQYLTANSTTPTGLQWTALPVATDSNQGIVELATTVETQTGVDNTRALTALGATNTFIRKADFTAKGQILASTGVCTNAALGTPTDGQYLVSCAACTEGMVWYNPPLPPTTAAICLFDNPFTLCDISVCICQIAPGSMALFAKYNPPAATVCMFAEGIVNAGAGVTSARAALASVGNTWAYLGFVYNTVNRCYQGSIVYTHPTFQVYCLNLIYLDNGATTMCALISMCRAFAQ